MKEIKFKYSYKKLKFENSETCKYAKLLDVINVNLENLSEPFITYDSEDNLFSLPKKGKYLMLIFQKYDNRFSTGLFTTLRKQANVKEKYYRQSIGHFFKIVIEEEKNDI